MSENIDVILKEGRKFNPPDEFVKNANVTRSEYEKLVRLGKDAPEEYWAQAAKELHWFKTWDKTLVWDPPKAQWFVGGKINASYNCLDRHLKTIPQKTALVWEGEPGEVSTWTYRELYEQVTRLTASLRRLGLKPGDCVAIYMPMIPEAVVAMLACARGGFPHTVIFGGFSAESIKDRVQDAEASVIITADFGYRKGSQIKLREQVDKALKDCSTVKYVIQVQRTKSGQITSEGNRSFSKPACFNSNGNALDWHELISSISHEETQTQGYAEELDSEHPLYILYTSGTTGKPKGIIHTTGGYLVEALQTTKQVFDIKPYDLYWCTADIGWVTGHTYIVYGPLAAGASIFMYEGAPTTPTQDRFWAMIERHHISILYTAPTAIRAFMRLGTEPLRGRDLSSLRLLGTVGEPINPEAWMWYRENVGRNHCPIVDTYWQTETGSIVISPIPGAVATKPGSATFALPGYDVDVVDKKGEPVPPGGGGYLVIKKPWPAMARTIHKDPERYKKQYFSEYPGGVYFTGDGARKDEDGYLWCLGRVDDVLNVSGHRIGTMEVESALVSHPKVAEAAVVGRPDSLKGQALAAFVTLKAGVVQKGDTDSLNAMANELKAHVTKEIGALARPDDIRFTDALPKTRSGKIMRRLLRELATSGQVKGDVTTLEDLAVIAALQKDGEE
ncbi:MAG: acetate--CoA ligase [Deltaproteobacteria bacterium]|nr:acetate--CoA ligase [Deltaproteobacteria bacterium]